MSARAEDCLPECKRPAAARRAWSRRWPCTDNSATHAAKAWALDGLGAVHTRLNRPDQVTALHQQALTLLPADRRPPRRSRSAQRPGEAALAAGHPADALAHHTTGLSTSPITEQQARAHTGLGHAHRTLGDHARARHHYEHALTLHTDLGTTDADDVRAYLTAVDAQPDTDHHQDH